MKKNEQVSGAFGRPDRCVVEACLYVILVAGVFPYKNNSGNVVCIIVHIEKVRLAFRPIQEYATYRSPPQFYKNTKGAENYMDAPKFKIKHIGITTGGEEEARALEKKLCALFGLPDGHENNAHIFAGDLFEIMKNDSRGRKGHVGLYTEDIEYGVKYFAEKGIGLVEETVKRDKDGKIIFAYLDIEFNGFAFHLTY